MATDVTNAPDLALQFFDNDGKPLASGCLKFFRSGTDIPASVYTSDGETALGPSIQLDASGFPVVQFSLKTGQLYTVKAFDHDDVLIWTRNDISGSSEGGGAGNWVPIEGTSLADPITGPLVIKYDDKTTILDNNALQSDTAMQVVAPEVSLAANDGAAGIIGTPRVFINAVGADSAQIYVQSDKKIEMQGSQIEIKAPNSGNEITINSKGLTEIIGGITNIQGNNGISLATTNSTNISCNGPVKFLGTATLNNKTVSDIWTSASTGAMDDTQLITAKAASELGGGSGGNISVEPTGPGNTTDPKIDRGVVFYKEVLGGSLPEQIKSYSFYICGETPQNLTNFRFIVVIYDDNGILVTPLTWSNTFYGSDKTKVFSTVNYDTPAIIDRKKTYRILVWTYQGNYTNIRFLVNNDANVTPLYGGPARYTMSDPGNYYANVPSTYPTLSFTAYTTYCPWFSLNSWSV